MIILYNKDAKREGITIIHPDNENLLEVLGNVNKALININKAIDDFEEQKDFERVYELKTVKVNLEISKKVIMYGLFHN
ncbi:hypothetical protein DZB86_26300 [Bacillus sp. RC]|nr:hypothetical protein DZB86_26300 [Bacillus sp. RC]